MQNISSLLKDLQSKKNEIQIIADTISEVSGVKISEKEIIISSGKGFNKLRLNVSGSKKTILILKKDIIQECLNKFGLIVLM